MMDNGRNFSSTSDAQTVVINRRTNLGLNGRLFSKKMRYFLIVILTSLLITGPVHTRADPVSIYTVLQVMAALAELTKSSIDLYKWKYPTIAPSAPLNIKFSPGPYHVGDTITITVKPVIRTVWNEVDRYILLPVGLELSTRQTVKTSNGTATFLYKVPGEQKVFFQVTAFDSYSKQLADGVKGISVESETIERVKCSLGSGGEKTEYRKTYTHNVYEEEYTSTFKMSPDEVIGGHGSIFLWGNTAHFSALDVSEDGGCLVNLSIDFTDFDEASWNATMRGFEAKRNCDQNFLNGDRIIKDSTITDVPGFFISWVGLKVKHIDSLAETVMRGEIKAKEVCMYFDHTYKYEFYDGTTGWSTIDELLDWKWKPMECIIHVECLKY